MTDVFLANHNGSLSILTKPLERSHEKFVIKVLMFNYLLDFKIFWRQLDKKMELKKNQWTFNNSRYK
jgi:hypothetical protein